MNNNSKNKEVFLAKEPLRNMIVHLFRFIDDKFREFSPVMGLCLGNIRNDQLRITRAIPIKHGSSLDEPFSSKDTEIFRNLQSKFESEGTEIIGWYRSHPNEGVELKESDFVNQAYFQRSYNKKAVCLIFDHALFDYNKNFGFSIYRINDLEHINKLSTLSFEIETPNSLEFFSWVKKFVEDFHKKSPLLIKEVSEILPSEMKDLQEIPGTVGVKSSESEYIDINVGKFQENFNECLELFTNRFNAILQNQIKNFIDVNSNNIIKNNEVLSNYISQLKDSSFYGFPKLTVWFEDQISDSILSLEDLTYRIVEEKVNSFKDFKSFETNFEKGIYDFISEQFNQNIKSAIEKINDKLKGIDTILKAISEERATLNENLKTTRGNIEEQLASLEISTRTLSERLNDIKQNTSNEILVKFADLENNINQIETEFRNFDDSLTKLKKITKEFKKI